MNGATKSETARRRKHRVRRAFATALAAASIAAAIAFTSEDRVETTVHLNPRPLDGVRLSDNAARVDHDHRSVALVLGGGGLRGFAHVGVLRALEEAGIRPDIVVGTVYANGSSPAQIEQAAHGIDVADLIDWTLDSHGLMRGERIADWVDNATGNKQIETFPIRFGAVATDLVSGEAVLLDEGSPGDAVRASAAVPGATVPVAYAGGHLVDGGVGSLVPVRFARAMGADIVIAVDIYCSGSGIDGLGAATVVRRAMRAQTCPLAKQELDEADIAIQADVPLPQLSAAESWQEAINAGYKAAKTALAPIER